MKNTLALVLMVFGLVGCALETPQEYERRKQIERNIQAQRDLEKNKALVNQKIAVCKSYGFSEASNIAKCVEREIRFLQLQEEQEKNSRRQPNYGAAIAKTLSEIGEEAYEQPKSSICNFKSFDGAIISGDCKKLAIEVGNKTYWRMD